PADPTLWPQREALKSALQFPALAGPVFDSLAAESFTHPGYAAVRAAIEAAGGTSAGVTGAQWIEAVRDQVPTPLAGGLVNELSAEAINADDEKLP
ncbi:DNA primase, partial [Mycobacterium sp. ITM-2017-0098]